MEYHSTKAALQVSSAMARMRSGIWYPTSSSPSTIVRTTILLSADCPFRECINLLGPGDDGGIGRQRQHLDVAEYGEKGSLHLGKRKAVAAGWSAHTRLPGWSCHSHAVTGAAEKGEQVAVHARKLLERDAAHVVTVWVKRFGVRTPDLGRAVDICDRCASVVITGGRAHE